MYNTYLFDFDGTLVDSMPAFISVMKRILDEHGISYGPDLVKIITPLGYAGTARYFRQLGLEKSESELTGLMNQYALSEYQYRIPAKETVIDTLIKLKEAGANLNVLTASPHSMLDPCLKRLGIYDLFTNVWSCDDFNTTKADPKIYEMAAQKLGADVCDVIFLDDNLGAVSTAMQAGMRVFGVYDKSSKEYTAEMKAVSERYIADFAELI